MWLLIQLLFIGYLNTSISTPLLDEPITSDLVESSARVVNGYEVDITEVSYQGSLRRRGGVGWSHICGAVIVHIKAVLTAAHCAESYEGQPSSLRVIVGTASRQSGGETYDVSKIIIHQFYSSETLENDIAILEIEKTMSFGATVRSIPVVSPNYYLPDGTEAVVSGFGTTSYEGSSSSVLLAAKVRIINQDSCVRNYIRMATITSGMLCASATDPPRDACQGDSGGPLVVDNNLVGIVSWGEGCAESVYPGVYTRISNYSSWISRNMPNVSKQTS